jgi:hypothetical protein
MWKTPCAKLGIALTGIAGIICLYRRKAVQQRNGLPMKNGDYIFGFPEEWAKFQERFPAFLQAFDALADTMNTIKVRTFTPRSAADETVFFLSPLVFEDFTEVWLMAGNGSGNTSLSRRTISSASCRAAASQSCRRTPAPPKTLSFAIWRKSPECPTIRVDEDVCALRGGHSPDGRRSRAPHPRR